MWWPAETQALYINGKPCAFSRKRAVDLQTAGMQKNCWSSRVTHHPLLYISDKGLVPDRENARSGYHGRERIRWRPRQNGGSDGVCWTRKASGGGPPSEGRRMFGAQRIRGDHSAHICSNFVRDQQLSKSPSFIFPSSTSGG
jgi:hypothetical protein